MNNQLWKIGIMGGSFNPIHNGHLILAQSAMEAAGLDRVLFMPAGYPYMKGRRDLLEGKERFNLVRMAVSGNPNFAVSDMEIRREGNSYTYETLEILCGKCPNVIFYFIVGADCLFTIDTWREPQRIFKSCILLAADRDGLAAADLEEQRRKLQDRYQARIILFDFPQIQISSTMIREKILRGKSIRYFVPEAVREYITENHLYTKSISDSKYQYCWEDQCNEDGKYQKN